MSQKAASGALVKGVTIEELGERGTETLCVLKLQQVRRAWQHMRFCLWKAAEKRLMTLRGDGGGRVAVGADHGQ